MTNLNDPKEREKLRAYYTSGMTMEHGSGQVSVHYAREASAVIVELLDALEEPPAKVTKDVYLRGEWYYTILKVNVTEDQLALLEELGERTKGLGGNTVEVEDHNPEFPLPNWLGATRK